LPDRGSRYVSAMVVNEDHYVNRVIHEPGDHQLTVEEFDTPYVVVAVRTLADPRDVDDMATAMALQHGLRIRATSRDRSNRRSTTSPASTPRAPRCWPLRRGWSPSSVASDARRRSTRYTTSSVQRPAGADFPTLKRRTSAWRPICLSVSTASPLEMCRLTAFGRFRPITQTATSSTERVVAIDGRHLTGTPTLSVPATDHLTLVVEGPPLFRCGPEVPRPAGRRSGPHAAGRTPGRPGAAERPHPWQG
jgi:hypothetical protein